MKRRTEAVDAKISSFSWGKNRGVDLRHCGPRYTGSYRRCGQPRRAACGEPGRGPAVASAGEAGAVGHE